MFEILLAGTISDEAVAEDWNTKRFYGKSKVWLEASVDLLHSNSFILFSQSLSITKAILQGQKPVPGNPLNDMTVEDIERQARVG